MNYETPNHIGIYSKTTPRAKTTAIASTTGRVCQLDAERQRCRRSAKRQTKVRTDSPITNDFLKCTFLPKLKTTNSVQACQKTERDFYQSLSCLAEHYNIEPLQTSDFDFPYNIALSIWDMQAKVKHTAIDWDSLKLVQDRERIFFVSEERYHTRAVLYYIPVFPIYRMLRNPKRKKTAHLLISVCSYLYHIADIPYYRQESSYLYWMYEMHRDWVEEDEEIEKTDIYIREFDVVEFIGDRIEQRLHNRDNLTVFEQRLSRFKIRDTFDHECWRIACNAFALYTEYPNASIFRHAQIPDENPEDSYYDNESVGMEKYISFICETTGWLFNNLHDSINNEFNECGVLEEPIISKQFDGSKVTTATLDFENRLFRLLDDLCTLLDEYKATER